MEWVILVVLLALVEFLVFGGMVGYARAKYKIAAPAITGNEVFERYFRVQQNTLEQLVVFIPSILVFSKFISSLWGAVLGAVFLLGRVLYALGYIRNPKQREVGFILSSIPTMILLIGAVIGTVRAILVIQSVS